MFDVPLVSTVSYQLSFISESPVTNELNMRPLIDSTVPHLELLMVYISSVGAWEEPTLIENVTLRPLLEQVKQG